MTLLLRNNIGPKFQLRPTDFELGRSTSLPAPYGGLNLRDDITSLQPNEARVLENWFPSNGQVVMRTGFAQNTTGLGSGEVKTLSAFVGLTTSKLIGAANGKIYDATTAGAATQLATGFSEDRWQTALYNNRLTMVNGSDAPQSFNGSTVSAAGFSGTLLTAANLVNVGIVRNRLWFCENNSADVWYGGVGSITGTLTKFQLSQIAAGGTCIAIGSWSRDAGDGADDTTVFVMSTGEIIVYQGDPATTFTISGKFAGAPPIGRQCLFKVGGELVIITRLGLLPVSAAIAGVALDLSRIDPWGKIAPAIVADAALHGDKAGWHGVLHEGVVYVNVPLTEGALSKQYVLNTRNGSWTVFRGWNASSLCSFANELYFGAQTGGLVNLVGSNDDQGTDITAVANCAFVVPQNSYRTNLFTLIRPKVQAEGSVTGQVGVDTDYVIRSSVTGSVDLVQDTSTTPWGSVWGSPWGATAKAEPTWFSCTGKGQSVSTRLRVTGATHDLRWFVTDLMFKPGGSK